MRLPINWAFDSAGDPTIVAGAADQGWQGSVEWRACPADGSACTPLPQSAYQAQSCTPAPGCPLEVSARPGPTPAGVRFEAVFTKDGTAVTDFTPAWQGRLTLVAPPVLSGQALFGTAVHAQGATWSGG